MRGGKGAGSTFQGNASAGAAPARQFIRGLLPLSVVALRGQEAWKHQVTEAPSLPGRLERG
jgi:hypothetical protein